LVPYIYESPRPHASGGLTSAGTHAAAVATNPKLPYGPRTDYDYLGIHLVTPHIMIVRKDFPADTLQEFVAYARAKGKDLKMGHNGVGSLAHLTCLFFFQLAGVEPTYVVYRGFGQTINDILSGAIDGTCELIASAREHVIGGTLVTLLYTAQLASISQDPWFSRVGVGSFVDHVAIDLDPPDGLPFARVLEVALRVRDTLAGLKTVGFPKTSGSGGLHIYIPMLPGTTYDAGLLYCQIVATLVATRHPKLATIERAIAARGNRIYVDYLQNIQGKTLASAYSPRANDFAGVSTPLTWEEVEQGVRPQDFTIANVETRLAEAGDLWARLRKAKGADLRAVTEVTGGRTSPSRKHS